MRAKIVLAAISATGLALIYSLNAASAENPMKAGTLCHGNERVLFSAAVKGGNKLVSICSSGRLDEKRGYLQYRFGRPGKIELEFPKSRVDTQSQFRYSRYTRPLVTYLALRFETGGYLYSIHQNFNAELKPAISEASITVTPIETLDTDPKPVKIPLREPVQGNLMKLENLVRRANEEPTFP